MLNDWHSIANVDFLFHASVTILPKLQVKFLDSAAKDALSKFYSPFRSNLA
jgi:hypothetical protein